MSLGMISKESGYVTKVKGYLLTIKGLPSAKVNDIVVQKQGRKAVIHSMSDEYVVALMLDTNPVFPGEEFFLGSSKSRIELGDHLKGKTVNALGLVTSGDKKNSPETIVHSEDFVLDVVARNIDARDFIKEQLMTGFSLVDITLPVGKGQRELIYGPIHSGKKDFLRSVIVNQKEQGNICVYAAIGKPITFTPRLVKFLEDNDVLDNTIIVSALSDESTPMIVIAPSTAFLIAEYFCNKGRDVVLVLDDLGVHAKYIRETALLSGQFPGRESYPGDIFYQHAHLMERSGSFNEKQGNGTITLFPVLETDIENFTNIVSTNIMASTDGHLLFSTEMNTEGFKPAISILESVTRVGHMTHNDFQRELSTKLMSIISEYPRQQEYSRFGTQMSSYTRDILKKGRIIYEFFNQDSVRSISARSQILLMSLVFTSFFEGEERDVEFIRSEREKILQSIQNESSFSEARSILDSAENDFEKFIEAMEKGATGIKGSFSKTPEPLSDKEKLTVDELE